MKTDTIKMTIYILFAFAFSLGVHLIWIYQFSGHEAFYWNGQFMINTNDGYYYAEGARDILAGFHQPNDLSPIDDALSILTAFFAKIFPFSFETIIFYMPIFLSLLIVIPLVLIGKSIKENEVGFIAALLGGIAWSYYNRTMVGYYDTDMLTIVFPTVLLWSLIWAIRTREDKYLLISALDSIAYRWWYPQSYSLEFAFIGLIFIFYVYQYIKKEEFRLTLLLIAFMTFAMINVDGWIRFMIVLALFGFVKFQRDMVLRYLYYIFAAAVVLFFLTGGFDPIWRQLKGYVFKDVVSATSDSLKLHFFTVMQTIREAGSIPFETFANRISGHMITFFASLAGYVYLCYKHRVMLLGLPMLGLGFLAYGGGLRFTVYAVPVMALGVAYLIVKVADFIEKPVLKYIFIAIATMAILAPNIRHIIDYKVPTVFVKEEVKVLDKIRKIASREDYVISWWDYGYPIRYYSDVKTLIDGGKHSGEVNFAPSFILTHPQKEAANLARLDVEYTERRFHDKNITHSNVAQMMKGYGFKDSNSFLESIKQDINLPKKTRDIYLYLPFKMGDIYPTITKFSSLDLMSGTSNAKPFFYQTRSFKENGNVLNLGNGILLEKTKYILQIGKNQVPIKALYMTGYDKDGKFSKKVQNLYPNGTISLIYAKSYNTFYIVDEATLNSTYVQLFLLEDYDEELFELVVQSPYAKVYKLKR